MRDQLQAYQIELTVKGPVFIGSGQRIEKKEYIFLTPDTLGVIDAGKLFHLAKRRGLEQKLEKFMVTDTKRDLKQWAIEHGVPLGEMQDCMKYVMNAGDMEEEENNRLIMECCVDPYGKPYVPGSSVKGMLRTILLCSDILRDRARFRGIGQSMERELEEEGVKRSVLQKTTRAIETEVFHTLDRSPNRGNAVNDRMAGIRVSDSEPLDWKDVILCQKWERHVDGTVKTLPILCECIKPGTKIRCSLTIDKGMCELSESDIMERISLYYEMYYSTFQSKFAGEQKSSENTVFLGGGSGFASKTLIYSLFGNRKGVDITTKIFKRTGVPGVHKHFEDMGLGASPHILKCTRYQGKEYHMGECEASII